jgi:hypothetical protein
MSRALGSITMRDDRASAPRDTLDIFLKALVKARRVEKSTREGAGLCGLV